MCCWEMHIKQICAIAVFFYNTIACVVSETSSSVKSSARFARSLEIVLTSLIDYTAKK